MKAAGEGKTDGNLDQGGSGPGPEDETATDRATCQDGWIGWAPVIAAKRVGGDGEREEAEAVSVGIYQITTF